MVMNPACPCVDATGNISLDGLNTWAQVSEAEVMSQAVYLLMMMSL